MRTSPLAKFSVCFLAAVGLMATGAASSQAQIHLWWVNGAPWSTATAIDALGISELLAFGVQISCHVQLTGTLTAANVAHAEIKTTQCNNNGGVSWRDSTRYQATESPGYSKQKPTLETCHRINGRRR